MDKPTTRIPQDFSEEEAHRILARAVEIDARVESSITLAQLRQVAAEAGITDASLLLALGEVNGSPRVGSSRSTSKWQRVLQRLTRPRLYAAVGSFIIAAALTPGDVLVQTALWALPFYGAYELILKLTRQRPRDQQPPRAPGLRPTESATLEPPAPRRDSTANHSLRLRLA